MIMTVISKMNTFSTFIIMICIINKRSTGDLRVKCLKTTTNYLIIRITEIVKGICNLMIVGDLMTNLVKTQDIVKLEIARYQLILKIWLNNLKENSSSRKLQILLTYKPLLGIVQEKSHKEVRVSDQILTIT